VRSFGRYQLVSLIASGGMAELWRAEVAGPAGVRKEVALKVVRGEHGGQGDFARMLVEEARLAARLTHANVVQVFELVEEGGRHAIAMELVRGRDLGRVLERCRELGVRLGLARAVHLGVEVARALAYAHRLAEDGRPLGLVHRDVSPHNVLVSFEGEVKLADFGIARAMSQAGLTDPGTVKGKLAYMAPEQARGEPVDGRADVFALGVLLWELCAGRRLHARESDAATLAALLSGEPISPPSAWNEAVPPDLDAAILAALARDPAARTPSADTLVAQLAAVLLRLARTPEDVDLRGLMQRLWPDGDAAPARLEQTAVRPAAGAAEPSATRTIGQPGGPAPAGRRTGRWALRAALAVLVVASGGTLARRLLGGVAGEGSTPSPAATAPAPAAAPPSPALADPPPAGEAEPPVTTDPSRDPALARRGQGRLLVSAHPWATVTVDGRAVGETPQDLLLQAGRHRVGASHPTIGRAEVEVELAPGERLSWRPRLRP